jgi:hypothetical protein
MKKVFFKAISYIKLFFLMFLKLATPLAVIALFILIIRAGFGYLLIGFIKGCCYLLLLAVFISIYLIFSVMLTTIISMLKNL